MASGDSPSRTPTRCLPRNAARSSCGSSSQDEERFGLKNSCFSSNETLKMMEIVDNPKGITSNIPEDSGANHVSLVGIHPYHTLEPDYGPPAYYDGHHSNTLPMSQGSSRADQSAEEIIQAVDDYLRSEHLTPESGNHSNRSSASLSDPEVAGNLCELREGQTRQEPIQMATLPSLPVIPEAINASHSHSHSVSSLYPSGTMASTASGYLRVDGSLGSCRSPIYETVSSNEGEQETVFGSGTPRRVVRNSNVNNGGSSGCSSCAQLRSLGLGGTGGSSTYKPTRSYNLPDNSTLATNTALNSMDNLRMHDRMHDGCSVSPTTVPVFMCNDKDGTTTQVVYPHIHQSKDNLKDRPSWRCLAVGFLVFALMLFAVIAFLTVLVMTRAPVPMESFNPSRPTSSRPSEQDEKRPDIKVPVTKPIRGVQTTTEPNSLATFGPSGPAAPVFIGPGTVANKTINPGKFWYLHFECNSVQIITYNLTINKHSSLVVYGKRGRLPSHSRFDFVQAYTLNGHRVSRDVDEVNLWLGKEEQRREVRSSTGGQRVWTFTEEFVAGEWFLGIFNDGDNAEEVQIAPLDNNEWSCPNDCSGNGFCVKGQCTCNPTYTGPDCSEGLCPVLCNNKGDYSLGQCDCHAGWKGVECNIAWDECLVPDCSGHGMCAQGECLCDTGYTGEDCSEEAVIETTVCANHSDCVRNAECVLGVCQCQEGWTGANCQEQTCVSSCSPHGECVDSRCVCDEGWNGKFCRLDGCPQGCSGHGVCQLANEFWQCICQNGFQGNGCQIAMELVCNDGQDNDEDQLIDCADPDCCATAEVCSEQATCQVLPDPASLMSSYTIPSQPFFEHYRSWIEPGGIQLQATFHPDDQSRASIVRGRVITGDSSPVPNVRVHASNQLIGGYTFTRADGWFDLLIMGGGVVMLEFQQSSLEISPVGVIVPVNEFVITDDIIVSGDTDSGVEDCTEDTRQPPIFSIVPHPELPEATNSQPGIVLDQQSVIDEIKLQSSQASLRYYSHRATGVKDYINVTLAEHPELHRIHLIHVQVDVSGVRWSKVAEPEPHLSVAFEWDKKNAYGKPVYGNTRAKVSVGYEYYSCNQIAWSVQAVTVHGQDWSTTNMGGWFVPVHHTYNPSTGVLLMGDGTRIDYSARPPLIHTIMGTGRPRTAACPQCDGRARNSRLLAPTAIASGLDGSVFVGDAELVLRIGPDGNSSVLVRLKYTPTNKYYLAVNGLENKLYLSEPQTRRIFEIHIPSNMSNLTTVEVLAGTGLPCSLVEQDRCGDNGPAVNARLYSPKGIAVSKDGKIYFIDGSIIRVIDQDHRITSFLGVPGVVASFRRPRCGSQTPITKLSLQYPTELAISPIDNALYVLDDDVILRITLSGMASVFAGIPSACFFSSLNLDRPQDIRRADEDVLVSPTALAFSPNGDLYVAETDYSTVHRVRVITPEGFIATVVGGNTPCDCQLEDCECFGGDEGSVVHAKIQSPIALTVSFSGDLIIVDQGNLRIRRLSSEYPRLHRRRFVYEIPSPFGDEMFFFDHMGFHFKTKHILLDETVFIFNYTDTHDSLVGIQDSSGFAVSIFRNGTKEPLMMELGRNGTLVNLLVNDEGLLTDLGNLPEMGFVQLEYQGGLLTRKFERNLLQKAYGYNGRGDFEQAHWSSGDVSNLSSEVNKSVAITSYRSPDRSETVSLIYKEKDWWEEVTSQGDLSERAYLYNNGTCQVRYMDGSNITVETETSPLLERVSGNIYHQRKIVLPDNSAQTAEWRYSVRRGGREWDKILVVKRKLKVNNQPIFSLEYNRYTDQESLLDHNDDPLLTISHNGGEQVKEWTAVGSWQATRMTYDNQGRQTAWQRGVLMEKYQYDNEGRMIAITLVGTNNSWNFSYHHTNQPERVILPGGRQYSISYTSDGQVGGINMPSGDTHFLNSQTSLGVSRNMYSFDGRDPWLIEDSIVGGLPTVRYYPGTGRRISKHYDSKGRLTTVIYDKSLINLNYHRSTGQLKLVELQEGDFGNVLRLKSTGSVLKQQTVVSTGFGGFLNAEFDYSFNSNFQITSISAEFNWTLLSSHEKTYDPRKGGVTRVGGFTVTYPDKSRHELSDTVFTIQHSVGEYILLQGIRYFIQNRNILSLSFGYDYSINIIYMDVSNADRALQFTYRHDDRGFLSAVLLNDTDNQDLYRYTYSPNGNLLTIENVRQGITTTLEYDHRDCVTRVGDVEYKHDGDGILSQRGEETFDYNSKGLLVHAYKPRAYDVRYKYDGLGRRIWKKDHTGQQVQFFYADPDNKWSVTHIYNKNLGELWTLDYDLRGALLSIRRNLRRWYVVTDHLGSILQVCSEDGEVLKELVYDPWGNVLEDSSPNLNIYIGYRGGLQDPLTKLVHLKGRDYDPMSGRWTSPDVSFYDDLGQIRKLRKFNLYTFQSNNPMNKDLEPSYMTDMDSWLNIFGYNINALLPSVGEHGQLSDFSWSEGDVTSWQKESGSVISQAKQNVNAMREQLYILPSKHLSSPLFTKRKKTFKNIPSLLGSGVEMYMPRGRILTAVTSPYVSGLELSLARVINGSLVGLQWQNSRKAKDFQYFFKTELKKFSNDINVFGLTDSNTSSSVASIDTNVTFQKFEEPKRYVKLLVSNSVSVWTIFYGLNGDQVADVVLQEAHTWATQQAWAKEKWAISNGRRGSRHWTSSERNEILEGGSLSKYEGLYTLDPRDYPAVAFDGNNIRLVRKQERRGR